MEHGVRTVVVAGLADFVIISEGWVFPFRSDISTVAHAIHHTLQNAYYNPKVSTRCLPSVLSLSFGKLTRDSMTCKFHNQLRLFYPILTFFEGGGMQGFQNAPVLDSFILDRVGAFGTVQSERNLTYYEVPLTGHMYVACQLVCLAGFLKVVYHACAS